MAQQWMDNRSNLERQMIGRAAALLEEGTVQKVVGWKTGDFVYDVTPAVFTGADELRRDFVYNDFCGANLSKSLIKASECNRLAAQDGQVTREKIAVFLKPCDSYSFNQLCTEHRIQREDFYVIGVESYGKADIDKIRARGIDGITSIKNESGTLVISTIYGEERVPAWEVMLDRCLTCKSKKHAVYDELLGEEGEDIEDSGRFELVKKLEQMSPGERYAFWQGELSRCIRCNACRNVCPACTCEQCVFDNPGSGAFSKAAADEFEEKLFHLIRAYHVAGRCTDCGECSRVCPQHIPLHFLNRKFIKDINTLYGPFQAGAQIGQMSPVCDYTEDHDAELSIVREGGLA